MKKQKFPTPPARPALEPVGFDEIRGHAVALRAIELAVAGGHSIMMVGPNHSGKSTLIAAMKQLATAAGKQCPIHFAVSCCACGNDPVSVGCSCSPRLKERWARKLRHIMPTFDIVIEVPPVPYRDLHGPGNPGALEAATARVIQASTLTLPTKLDGGVMGAAERVVELATRRLALTPEDLIRKMHVAGTVARHAGSKMIEARHIAEAIQYYQVRFN